ncbi:glycosyltransferase family 39 protein [Microcystis aeruginosa]|uniref:ArnT family glycosyltransferase n=1 Tax=Microcystis aeruginosa TaxID=1126 RepID=UPI0011EA884D|nr:glycosyl transferase [Microcystis aeruginosa]TYT71196.1 glycosyl transferase [Microcystis aeruginosa KLA2]
MLAFKFPSEKTESDENKWTEKILLLIFAVCLIHSFWGISGGWNNPLIDVHAFRQTQTAISVFYLLKGSPWLAYETPVLGVPWSIPLEFPLYQGIVAILVKLLQTPIDQTGRFVSAFFFYLSLIPIYVILSYLQVARAFRWLFLSLFLASPLYLFWARTFMIESTALFFSLAYLACIAVYFRYKSPIIALLACLFGIAASLTKVTTMAGFLILACVWIGANWFKKDSSRNLAKDLLIPVVVFIIIPFLIAKIWVNFTDAQKLLNPMAADFITSKALRDWNFGTIAQKLSRSQWRNYLTRTLNDVFGGLIISVMALVILPIFTSKKLLSYGLSLLFILTVAIFTNLHFVHNYYPYANAIFLLGASGFTIMGLIEKQRKIWQSVGWFFLALILLSQLQFYRAFWYPTKLHGNSYLEIASQVQTVTSPEGVLLIYGDYWSSLIPYYSQRRALMIHNQASEEESKNALYKLSRANYQVEAIVFCRKTRENREDKKYLNSLYNPNNKPVFSNKRCDTYTTRHGK